MTYKMIFAAALMLPLWAGVAHADSDDCYVPMANWQPRGAVQDMAEAKGWTVRRIKTDDGCYEIKARDETGCEIEAKVDPATLKIIKLEREHHCKQSGGDDSDDSDDDSDNRRLPVK